MEVGTDQLRQHTTTATTTEGRNEQQEQALGSSLVTEAKHRAAAATLSTEYESTKAQSSKTEEERAHIS